MKKDRRKRTNDWMVGLAIIVALVVIVASTLWLQEADIGEDRQRVDARFRDVGNTQVGNSVVIRGVKAGTVTAIALADSGWVVLSMELEEGVTLPFDPVVLLQSSSLFGEWQAVVTARSGVPRRIHPQLDDVDFAPPRTMPGAVLPDVAQLTSVAGGIASDVASVAERVRTAFDDEAARELRASLRNFNQMTADLSRTVRAQSRNLDSIAVDVRSGAGDLSVAAASLARTIERADTATDSGEIRGIVEETQRAVTNIREASARLNAMTASLEGAEGSLRGALAQADTVFGKLNRGEGSVGLLLNDPSLYRNSDSLMVDLRALIADVKKNPKRYFGIKIF